VDDGSQGSRAPRRDRPVAPHLSLRVHAGTLFALTAALAGCGQADDVVTAEDAIVARVGDGDTLDVRTGERIRLVQIDAPELGEGECYAREAKRELERLALPGTRVELEPDPRLDDEDRYGRLLRYVLTAGTNINVELVRRGAATPYFRSREEGAHSEELLAAVDEARAARRGMWGSCRVSWEPDRAVTTRSG
jgi:micrococcal nuclease